MFIWWGSKSTEHPVTTVADYCPLHMAVHSFELVDVRTSTHVYGVTMGRGRHASHVIRSTAGCRHMRRVDLAEVQLSDPELRHRERLEVASHLRADPDSVDPATRVALLREVIFEACRIYDEEPTDSDVLQRAVRPVAVMVAIAIMFVLVGLTVGIGAFAAIGLVSLFLVLFGSLIAAEITKTRLRKERARAAVELAVPRLAVPDDQIRSAIQEARRLKLDGAKALRVPTRVSGLPVVEPAL